MNKIVYALSVLSILLLAEGCYYDKYENFEVKGCDTTSVNYTTHIKPILDNSCNNCHSGNSPSGGINLSNYSAVKDQGISGKLLGSVIWDGTASRMPQGSSTRLDDCSLAKIRLWIKGNYNP